MLRRVLAALASIAVVLAGLTVGAGSASAGTAPDAATFGASAAVDVTRSPAYPTCTSGTPNILNQWTVTSTGSPYSQSAFNDTNSYPLSRVNLSSVSYHNGTTTATTAAYLKVALDSSGVTPNTFKLQMFKDGTSTELKWDTSLNRWNDQNIGNSFATTGYVYALYSGGFLHEGTGTLGPAYNIGTFLMIDSTLPSGSTLTYEPSPGVGDNICSGSRTYATSAGMSSTSLGGSGTITTPSSGSSASSPPPITLDFDGNGGTCTPSSVTGDQGTWGTALTADQCTNGSRRLAFFSTSPTAATGATNVAPGGPIYFLEANRLYAIWAVEKPSPVTDVVATSGLNSLKVTWKPPVSNGGDPINSYCIALRTETNANPFPRCVNSAQPLEFTTALPATNSKYSFTVFARNAGGSSEPVASALVSPYDIKGVTASRKDVLLGLGGTQVEARGEAPGLAGQTLNVEYKVGAGQWITQVNAVKVDATSKFRWSNKFPRSSNKNAVSVRFSYGSDAVAGPFVLDRGGEAGDLSAPRNIRAKGELNKISLTWDPPKFDGGAKIIGYTICAQYIGTLCREVGPGREGDFRNLLPGAEYSFTVAARTAAKTGPKGKANKAVTFTEASVRVLEREPGLVTTEVKGKGFKDGAKFRVEVAIVPTNGRPRDTWRWDEIREFTADRSFAKAFGTELGSSYDDQTIAVRLVTPLGSVYSRASRPPR